MKLVHVLQHTAAEHLGLIEDHLEGRGVRFRYHRPFAGRAPLPRPDALDEGLILLGGGAWGSAGVRDLPTLRPEIDLAAACLARGRPVMGVGLGAQILALAAGARSRAEPVRFEVGTARRTVAGALEGYLPESFPVAIYQRDRAILPAGAEVLAVDERGEPALWEFGPGALAFSAHPGLKVGMVEDLVMESEELPENVASGLDRLRALQRSIEDALVPIMTGIARRFDWVAI